MNDEPLMQGPDWAYGCEYCDYGLISEPEALVTGYTSLYLRRAVGQHIGATKFCTCRAGLLSHQKARKNWGKHGNPMIERQAREYLSNPQPTRIMGE